MDKKIVYSMEEVMPLLAELTMKYTGNDSTSVTYETAQALMEAVLYCIEEAGRDGPEEMPGRDGQQSSAVPAPVMSAREAYTLGCLAVQEKTEKALCLYNEIMKDFCDYGSLAYHDTMVKGMPAFFRHYDVEFQPQETILTLDYPLREPITGLTGIDMIYAYLVEIKEEQRFLHAFPEDMVREALKNYHFLGGELFINVSEVLIGNNRDW